MALTHTDTPVFVDEEQAGVILGGESSPISPRTMQRKRIEGGGPPFRKYGQLVRYELNELLAWAEAQRRVATTGNRRPHPPASAASPTVAASTVTAEQPRKRRGWPKGKPRGPRKAKPAPPNTRINS